MLLHCLSNALVLANCEKNQETGNSHLPLKLLFAANVLLGLIYSFKLTNQFLQVTKATILFLFLLI